MAKVQWRKKYVRSQPKRYFIVSQPTTTKEKKIVHYHLLRNYETISICQSMAMRSKLYKLKRTIGQRGSMRIKEMRITIRVL